MPQLRPPPSNRCTDNLGRAKPLKQDRLARPLTGAFPKDAASNLGLVRIERRIVRSRHGRLVPASSSIYSVQFRNRRAELPIFFGRRFRLDGRADSVPHGCALNLTACAQFTFILASASLSHVAAIVMSPMNRILAQKIIIIEIAPLHKRR
jgi:hypothetical protein